MIYWNKWDLSPVQYFSICVPKVIKYYNMYIISIEEKINFFQLSKFEIKEA